jgi:hypothetical protein
MEFYQTPADVDARKSTEGVARASILGVTW